MKSVLFAATCSRSPSDLHSLALVAVITLLSWDKRDKTTKMRNFQLNREIVYLHRRCKAVGMRVMCGQNHSKVQLAVYC